MASSSSSFEQILYVEATPVGFFGAALLHILAWMWLHGWEYPGFMSFFYSRFTRTKAYGGVIRENFTGDPVIDLIGFHKVPQMVYFWNFSTAFHHGFGGLLMLLGWYFQLPGLWRHGMLVEVAGYDTLDLGRMLYCVVTGDASKPMPMCSIIASGSPWVKLQVFHHTVGLTVGTAVIIYFSELADFQEFGFVIMGGPLFVLLPGFYFNLFPKNAWAAHTVDKFIQMVVWFHQRIWYFFPATYRLMSIVLASENVSAIARLGFYWGAFAMSVFNVAIMSAAVSSFVKSARSRNNPTLQRCRSLSPTSIAGALVEFEQLQGSTFFFASTKAHVWAQRAKKRVAEKDKKHA